MKRKCLLSSLGNLLLILSVASLVLFSGCLQSGEKLRGGFTEEQVKTLAQEDTIQAGDQEITSDEVKAAYQNMPEDLKAGLTQDDVLVSLINEELLLQQAEAEGIIPSGAELSPQEKQDAVNRLLEEKAGLNAVKVTDQEVDAALRAEFTGEILAEDPEVATFLREKAEEKLLLEKKQEKVEEYVGRLQDEAEIQ